MMNCISVQCYLRVTVARQETSIQVSYPIVVSIKAIKTRNYPVLVSAEKTHIIHA